MMQKMDLLCRRWTSYEGVGSLMKLNLLDIYLLDIYLIFAFHLYHVPL